MVDVPPEIAVRSLLVEGAVFYFEEESFRTDDPHYFVVLNQHVSGASELLMVNATSKVAGRLAFAQSVGLPEETIVLVSPTECPFLRVDSAFDCNDARIKTVQQLVAKVESGALRVYRGAVIDRNVLERIRAGVRLSRKVNQRMKDLL